MAGARRSAAQGGRPTLEAVAARAGVGRGTVSRVINGSSKVSEKTREAVLEAIEELGYVPNQIARALVSRRTDTVLLVITVPEERIWDEPYFARIIRGISAGLNSTGLQLILAIAHFPQEYERLKNYFTAGHADGVLLSSLRGDDPLPRLLEESGIPSVMIGAPTGFDPVVYVDLDNKDGARRAVRHLVDRGRRRIATIAGPQNMRAGVHRLEGYRGVLHAVGLDDELVAYGDFSADLGAHAMRELLDMAPDLDAVFAASDPMAVGAMRVLKEYGRRIPDDVAVVGFDDSPSAVHTDPPLTTVHQPLEAMGREMARLIVAQIRDEPISRQAVVFTPHLVVRDSS